MWILFRNLTKSDFLLVLRKKVKIQQRKSKFCKEMPDFSQNFNIFKSNKKYDFFSF